MSGMPGWRKRRRRRRALDRAHAEGVAALEAEHLERQAGLQHAGLVALHHHQVGDVELHLDAVEVGDGGAFVGLDDVVHRGGHHVGRERDAAGGRIDRPQRGRVGAAVGGAQVQRHHVVHQLLEQRADLPGRGDAELGEGVAASQCVQRGGAGVFEHDG
jgi:hypothetical protein